MQTPHSPLTPPRLTAQDTQVLWTSLLPTAQSLAIGQFAREQGGLSLVMTSSIHEANRLRRELSFFINNAELPILRYPDWETLAYDHFSPHEDIVSERLAVLHRARQLKTGIIIAAIPTLLHYTIPQSYLDQHACLFTQGDTIEMNALTQRFVTAGYLRVDQVREHGEFCIRGSICDVFPSGSDEPYRIEFFDNEIESIRAFDPDTQLSAETINQINLLPAREYPLTEDAISTFRQNFRDRFSGNPKDCGIYEVISEGRPFPGTEYYLPLFYEQLSTFFDYLPQQTTLFMPANVQTVVERFWDDISHRYDQLQHDLRRPICPPQDLFLSKDNFFAALKPHVQIRISEAKGDNQANERVFDNQSLPDISVNRKSKAPFERLNQFIKTFDGNLLITAESTGRREALLDQLKEAGITPRLLDSWQAFLNQDDNTLNLTIAPLDHGLILQSPNRALIPEAVIFGEQVMQRRRRQKQTTEVENVIHSLGELKIGAPVVHLNHGVGRYLGLQVIETGGLKSEYMTLEYDGGDKIYVPINALHLISRYTGVDAEHARLNRLGNNKWSQTKAKALKQIHDVAAELLKVYSERAAQVGHAYPKPDTDYHRFRADFPFEETPDQATAIDSVVHDLTQPKSMDRLVCGDVGFGKTEVAMQAAFYVANHGKQVAILAPTTLLAEQHYHNFSDRFADWPIKIGVLTRLQTKKDQDATIEALKSGKVDIVIGTHKLLQSDIEFKDLGLLIIDEEQRFGVRQKERIRQLRATVDILTLTATPIPRTLNMAFGGLRDLSIISTPPLKRLSVKTFLYENSNSIIIEAITREIMRGGQVYFLHNDVATIEATAEKLRGLVSEAKIAVAHGQMRERQLEQVMSDFYHQRFNVLVCSTIIESGIDIPSANTIIIERADKFGLSQLHQLRGRVGRSHHQAYAYLLVPSKKGLTKDAQKRLEAITTFEDLGAGFMLATHDLEIRGAGELLGDEQSGNIEAIGFSLYMELLDEAVKALKAGEKPALDMEKAKTTTDIDLHVSSIIPEDYIGDVGIRLSLYKRLSACKTEQGVHDFKMELIDRFGMPPIEVEQLLLSTKLRIKSDGIGIQKIDIRKDAAFILFDANPKVNMVKLIELIQKEPKTYQLQGADKLRIALSDITLLKKVEYIIQTINQLSEPR